MLDHLFIINLKINLIFSLYLEKCINSTNGVAWRMQNPEQQIRSMGPVNLKLCAPFIERTLSLVGIWYGYLKKREKERIREENKSVHIGYSD